MLAALIVSLATSVVPGMINPGTPPGVPASYDCAVRIHAYEFGKATLPQRGEFRTLYDALQLHACNVTTPTSIDAWTPPTYPTPKSRTIFVAPNANSGGDGTINRPFGTIEEAVASAANKPGSSILLRAGTHYSGMSVITQAHQQLTIQNYEGEHAIVSGGVAIPATKNDWKPYKVSPMYAQEQARTSDNWKVYQDENNVFGRAHPNSDDGSVKFLGVFKNNVSECMSAMNASKEGPFNSITWHDPDFKSSEYAGHCYGDTSTVWQPRDEPKVWSVRGPAAVGPTPPPPPPPPNIWALDLSEFPAGSAAASLSTILGIRLNGGRAIRAKYPNGNPELSGPDAIDVLTYNAGWITDETEWVLPADKWADTKDDVANADDWPGVNWPTSEEGGRGQEGEGDWGDFHIGHGGFCDDINPPAGYWCSRNPPRGNCYNPTERSSRGCTQTHMSPDGFTYTDSLLPHAANYSNPKGAVVQAWRCIRWFTNLCLVDSIDKENQTIRFDPNVGCNQGGEGCVRFQDWWIENVMEELDSPEEWFFNETTKTLYFFFNNTQPSGNEQFVATKTKVLFNVSGSQDAPIADFTIRGLEIRDTAYTYLGTDPADVHGMPSGGDWALQRSGAILLEGTERAVIDENLITRIDGNAVFISNYNRNTTVSHNEMSWIGDTAIASWGSTSTCLNANCSRSLPWGVGPDARGGNQPRGNHIVGNLVREIGIWQKQSSMYFQATSMHSHVERNVHFNNPRAGLNFNDGMGGGDVIEGNLLANCVRESGDHGPWNSWDRIPYITNEGMIRNTSSSPIGPGLPGHMDATGTPSVVPRFREIRRNFIVGVYQSQEDIDTDDGSSYYQTHDNYFAMAGRGLKSDFGGEWHHSWNNIYGYVGQCYGSGPSLAFYNNTCVTTSTVVGRCPEGNMIVQDNRILVQNPATAPKPCNSTLGAWPTDKELTQIAKQTLLPFPLAAKLPLSWQK